MLSLQRNRNTNQYLIIMLTLRIKEICRDKGITLNDLAEKIGVSQPSISGIATGRQKPSFDTLEKLATALDVPVTELFDTQKESTITCPPLQKIYNPKSRMIMNEELNKLLQECDTLKARLSGLRPLPAEALKKIEEAFAIEYTYESNRIEGNTLTLQETELVVNEGVTIAGKSMREHLEAINHAEAIDYIKDFAKNGIEISERTIKEIHALVLHGINRENAGRYRSVPVMISGSTHVPPQPYLLEKQMEDFIIKFREMEAEKVHPVLIAAFLHDELVRIHPFIDGNGRTSRLLMNLYLLRNGFTLVALKGNNEEKISYYKALEASHTENNPLDFQKVVAEAEITSLKRYLSVLGETE